MKSESQNKPRKKKSDHWKVFFSQKKHRKSLFSYKFNFSSDHKLSFIFMTSKFQEDLLNSDLYLFVVLLKVLIEILILAFKIYWKKIYVF